MNSARFLNLFLFLALLDWSTGIAAGGQRTQPAPARSEYLRTEDVRFVLERGESGVDCALAFAIIKPRDRSLYLRTIFENPAGRQRLVVDSKVSRSTSHFSVRSPAFLSIEPYHVYRVRVLIFDAPDRKHLLSEHVQSVRFIPFA